MRILAIDDDPIILDLLRSRNWLGQDHDLTCCDSAEAALDLLATTETPFETLLIDVFMPGKDGITLCAEVRAMPDYAAIPIIVMTASREVGVMQRAFGAGATDFVTKPFNGLELGTRIMIAGALYDGLQRERQAATKLADLSAQLNASYLDVVTARQESGLMRYMALENKLLAGAAGCLALRLSCLRTTGALPDGEVAPLAADLLEEVTRPDTDMAYIGAGRFVVVTYGRRREDLAAVAQRVNARLAARGSAHTVTLDAIADSGVWTARSCVEALRTFAADHQPAAEAMPEVPAAEPAALRQSAIRPVRPAPRRSDDDLIAALAGDRDAA